MDDCIFCKIVKGEIPSTKVYEDEDTLAFLDINPVNPGHTLVIPKKHSTNLYDMDDHSLAAVMRTAQKVAVALKKGLEASGINLSMNNEKPAGQHVFHPHIHVIPRFTDDGHAPWKHALYKNDEAESTAEKIRAALS